MGEACRIYRKKCEKEKLADENKYCDALEKKCKDGNKKACDLYEKKCKKVESEDKFCDALEKKCKDGDKKACDVYEKKMQKDVRGEQILCSFREEMQRWQQEGL